MNILEVKNLKKYFATQKAVDDISFACKRDPFLVCSAQTVPAKRH